MKSKSFFLASWLFLSSFLYAEDIASPYNLQTGEWNIAWPGRVAKHDLVYLSPPGDPMQGIPLGSGDVGVLCWMEGSRLILAVNKSNLWDDAAFERFKNWAHDQEDISTTLRHAGRIILDFGYPVFDTFYLSDFNARLSLADASLHIFADSPFGKVNLTLHVTQPDGLILAQVKTDFQNPTNLSAILERYGSRTFSHWYSKVNRNPSIGLGGTQSGGDANSLYLTHELTSGTFAMAAVLQGQTAEYQRINSYSSILSIKNVEQSEYTLAALVTDPLPAGEALPKAKMILADLSPEKIQMILECHRDLWKQFWLRSLMEFGSDYYDNLWHLMMYYANASQRGASPGRFCNGLWGWNRDVQNWNFYFHWNQQQIYWPLHAAGHSDLLESYLNYRFNSLPYAKKDAKEVFSVEGAVVSDVTDRRGCNSASEFKNHTPVAEIALDFWRHYQYTGDEAFLKTKALPYLIEAASFFESLFEKESDGLYHAKNGTGYEGWIELKDAITEIACGKMLFDTTLRAAEIAQVNLPRGEIWKEISRNLAPIPTIPAGEGRMNLLETGQTYKLGFFKNQPAPSRQILCAGYELEKNRWVTFLNPYDTPPPAVPAFYRVIHRLESGQPLSWEPQQSPDWKGYDGIFPTTEYSAVFPSGCIRLAQKDSPLFHAAVNTARLYAPEMMGWDVNPIVLARLGLGEELAQILHQHPDKWQFYCNGLGHYGPLDNMKPESGFRFYKRLVRNAALPDKDQHIPENKFPFELWPFRHMDLEAIAVFSTAMNEALLQSYDGVLRIAPATDKTQAARFSLHAAGGFLISAEIQNGVPRWVSIQSRLGRVCTIQNPWPTAYLYVNGTYQSQSGDPVISLPTQANDILTLVPDKEMFQNWKTIPIEYSPNPKEKISPEGFTSLGLPRMF